MGVGQKAVTAVIHWSNACGYDGPYIVDGRPTSTVHMPDVTCPECKAIMRSELAEGPPAMEYAASLDGPWQDTCPASWKGPMFTRVKGEK